MTQERLTVRKIREVLRLKYEVGLSDRAIAGDQTLPTLGQLLGHCDAGSNLNYIRVNSHPQQHFVRMQNKSHLF